MDIEAEKRRGPTFDAEEAQRFEALASEWWDEGGKFRALHAINPARLQFIRDAVSSGDGVIDTNSMRPLQGRAVLDIGCGGGILAEPLARLGGQVTGVDPVAAAIDVAKRHAAGQGLEIEYRAGLAEDLASEGRVFDTVIASEVIEHVTDVDAFLEICRALTKPGGLLIISTINRTARSYALAIVMAERVLGLVPRDTHSWEKFVTVEELRTALERSGFEPGPVRGIVLDILRGDWTLSDRDTSVNYIATAKAV